MSVRANLKAAKAALDAEDFDKAIVTAQDVLGSDPHNYFATVFMGRAHEKQGDLEAAAKDYELAAKSRSNDSMAWLGLCSVYEAQGPTKIDLYREAAIKAADVFAQNDDQHRCQTTIDKFVDFARQHGSPGQYVRALQVLLPGGPVFDYLEGRIQHPSYTYRRIAEITEHEEDARIQRDINERRTRLGARLSQVTADVKREIFTSSDLENLYQQVIDWSNDDEIRREYEEKLLRRAFDVLALLPLERKGTKLNQVLDLAEGMVIIKHAFQLAWDLVLETRDLDDLCELDVNVLREYIRLFPQAGLSKVLRAWLSSELCPFPPIEDEDLDDDDAGGVSLKPREFGVEDRLLQFADGLISAEESPFAHRLVCDYYVHLEEYESAVDTARKGLTVLAAQSGLLGMGLQHTKDALNSALATALVHYQAPRNHDEARQLFEDIQQRKPKHTPSLIGLGLIFEETEDFKQAVEFFSRAKSQDTSNIRVKAELAWCRALCGDHTQALQGLEDCLLHLKVEDPRAKDLQAKVLHRIGICMWELHTSRAARKDRSGAYARFLAAIKANVNYAPAYTSLGYYYADYSKDKKRARQCFQKAFELSTAETDAAERLAQFFADQGDWDIVEVIAQRVVASGRARPPPGSKKQGLSWPYSALGVVQMNKQEYQQAVTSFLAALRISPDDYQSYVGLGESYHNSGRYNSALRTFQHALERPDGTLMKSSGETWFARYMLANVHRELGDYDEAILVLERVLQERPREFGALISLLQTFVEHANKCLETGLFGQAIESAKRAIATAEMIAQDRTNAFNMWKALGDACMVFSVVESAQTELPTARLEILFSSAQPSGAYDLMTDVDHVGLRKADAAVIGGAAASSTMQEPLRLGILSYKYAVAASSGDIPAQAVAWYNLGLAEYRAYSCLDKRQRRDYLRAAVRCCKRAIELEAGNAEFWNLLGVVTTTLNPKVAQHAFVRSLHLNELNAKVWANLGGLYLMQEDYELAHQAFSRSQSTDPTYAHAWVGEGLIALLLGNAWEALNHFSHAFEISESTSLITKRQFALSSFDHLLVESPTSNDLTKHIRPIFALQQIRTQQPQDLPYRHLAALFFERVGNHVAAVETLTQLCAAAEAEYETSESLPASARFAHAKSDLARNLLAQEAYKEALENAATALDLTVDAEGSGLDAEVLRRTRLSAHLTAGLASHRLSKTSEAIAMFRTALEESAHNPDVVCSLVKVLWSHGGSEEKDVAREQLLECVERWPEHVGAVSLLGAVASLDDDTETLAAATSELQNLRTKDELAPAVYAGLEVLIESLSALAGGETKGLAATQTAIVLRPDHPAAWAEFAAQTGDSHAAGMALAAAKKSSPPAGEVRSEELAMAFAGVGSVGDAQRAVALAPWCGSGWEVLTNALV